MRRIAAIAVLGIALARPAEAQQPAGAFEIRTIRPAGLAVGVNRTVGDWIAAEGFSIEAHGVDAAWGPLSAQAAAGRVTRAGARHDAVLAAADVAFGMRVLPIMVTIGGEFTRARISADTTITRIAAPVTVANSAVLVFQPFWVHPIIAAGVAVHRTDAGDAETGIESYGAAGVEIGAGPVSLRAELRHRFTARQQAQISLRIRP